MIGSDIVTLIILWDLWREGGGGGEIGEGKIGGRVGEETEESEEDVFRGIVSGIAEGVGCRELEKGR